MIRPLSVASDGYLRLYPLNIATSGYLGIAVIPVDDETSGGSVYGHYAYNDPYNPARKEVLAESIVQVETSLIDLQRRAQELRLKEIALRRTQETKYNQLKEEAKLQASLAFILQQIELERRNLLALQNEFALLVLIMSCPFLKLGGVQTIM